MGLPLGKYVERFHYNLGSVQLYLNVQPPDFEGQEHISYISIENGVVLETQRLQILNGAGL